MRELKQKCDYCLVEVTDLLPSGFEVNVRLARILDRDACGNCHEKAGRYLDSLELGKVRKEQCNHLYGDGSPAPEKSCLKHPRCHEKLCYFCVDTHHFPKVKPKRKK